MQRVSERFEMKAKRLVLGSAQFGMTYGITNIAGKPNIKVLQEILDCAHEAGIDTIDTAPAYGDSEMVLGKLNAGQKFDFITKTLSAECTDDIDLMLSRFHQSLAFLDQPFVRALLFHDADILSSASGDALFRVARRLREEGLIKRLGVSTYTTDQIDAVLGKFDVDIVQVPINLIDSRLLVSGALERLKDRGVEVHARSAFLQGVLLQSPVNLPAKLSRLSPHVNKFWKRLEELNLTPLEACMGFLQSNELIDRVVIGVSTPKELKEILMALDKFVPGDAFNDLAISDPSLLDPRLWS